MNDRNIRMPPHSADAEQAVIGALLLDPRTFARIEGHVTANDFYRTDHRLLFELIGELKQRGLPFDCVTLGEQIEARGLDHATGGASYVIELASTTPSAANAKAYAQIVRDKATQRALIGVGTDVVNSAFQPDGLETDELIASAEMAILAVRNRNNNRTEAETGRKGLMRAIDEMQRRAAAGSNLLGISTSIDELDEMTSGLQDTDLIVVAARPSMGKTALMSQLRRSAARLGRKPYTVSLEMSSEQIYMRDLASEGRVNLKRIQNPALMEERDQAGVHVAVARMQDWAWWLDDQGGMTPELICARIRRAKIQHDIGIAFIDYLQLIQLSGDLSNIPRAIQNVTSRLKALAKELRIPIVLLSQLNRGLESRTDKRPMMSDLRESGAIEQDADLIVFLHREGYYHKEWPKDDPRHVIAELIVAKQRQGETGIVTVRWEGPFQLFQNLSREEMPGDYETQQQHTDKRNGKHKSSAGFDETK